VSLPRRHLDRAAITMMVSLCLLWGMSQIAIRVANRGVAPIFQGAVRSITAALLVALWSRMWGQPLVHRDRTLWHGLAIGLLFGTEFVFISGFTFLTPIFGMLLGCVLLQEPLTLKLLIGGGLVAGGMILVNWPSGGKR